MKPYKFFWETHKWTGIVLALVFLMIGGTGLLLLVKKDFEWIQPATQKGAPGELENFITVQEMFAAVFASGHEDFKTFADVDRVDFRPDKRVHKVQSVHNHSEIQICAITGAVLGSGWRGSDLFENLHDGSFFGDWVHDWFMLLAPLGLIFLVGSGLFLWLQPALRKRRNRKHKERPPAKTRTKVPAGSA